ncbi:hypothetical protein [Paenibacillus apis]|uniref:Uncharacterized protein n=1 Tax=Paenibacillus apis TaxID=1792174 RepID=A0A919Y3N3_9BACL|nr:hypothetical protein [Paenibacillus apis]GIO43864.1 hypothetical protein J41TS4_36220 [Paenibacillus apis]
MRRFYCLGANLLLLAWFFLIMTGLYFENSYLVTRSWKEDGIFFVLFVLALALFIWKEHIGKYVLMIWLTLWLITQLIFHEWYTVTGGGAGKIRYFEGSVKLIDSEMRYIPDLYHIVLHLLIFISLLLTVLYTKRKQAYK